MAAWSTQEEGTALTTWPQLPTLGVGVAAPQMGSAEPTEHSSQQEGELRNSGRASGKRELTPCCLLFSSLLLGS